MKLSGMHPGISVLPSAQRVAFPFVTPRVMPEADLVRSLRLQLAKYDAAIAEFAAVDAQLQQQRRDARIADMIRVNRDAINSMERSADLVKERLNRAIANGGSSSPF